MHVAISKISLYSDQKKEGYSLVPKIHSPVFITVYVHGAIKLGSGVWKYVRLGKGTWEEK